MHTKTNDELVEMIYAGHDKYDEALQQLIHNLIPMMLKLGRMYLGKIPIYDNDDFIQEGSILIWKKVKDRKWNPGSGRFCNFFYSAFRFHVLHMYRDYVMKNMIKINEDEDYYCYGYRICTLVVDEFAIEYREKQKERNKAWAIKTGRQKPKSDEPMKPKMTPEEKAEKERQRRREYFAKHAEHYAPCMPPYLLQHSGKGWYVPENAAVPDGSQRHQRDYEHVHTLRSGRCS